LDTILVKLRRASIRKAIVEVLVGLGRDDPRVFAPYLSDPRWYRVRNLVLVLSLLNNAEALEMIAGLVSHREERVRREVLGLLQRPTDPKVQSYLAKILRDESSGLRMRALVMLTREKTPLSS
jgi:HEAT repeat protein